MRRCSISIDLDSLACYYRIHALGPAPAESAHVVIDRCLPRFLELFAERDLRATFFVVGQDADGPDPAAVRARDLLSRTVRRGHELGNHSYSHPYDLARLPDEEVAREIAECDRVLYAITGQPTAGFRAPGYDLSAPMLEELARLGYRYDSSIFPAPGYYAAKAAVLAAQRVLGQPSGAVLTDPRALLGPADPYRPSMTSPWRRGQAPLVELPIAVTPWLRVPAIGTSLLLAPDPVRRAMVAAMAQREFFNFELHGIDLADAATDGIPPDLVARQPDLRLPLARKLEIFADVIADITARFEVVTLAEASAWAHREAA